MEALTEKAMVTILRWVTRGMAVATIAISSANGQRVDSTIVPRNDSVMIRMVDVDVRALIQALARYLDRPVVFGPINGTRVSLETPTPIPTAQVLPLLRGVLSAQNLEFTAESTLYRVHQKETSPASPQPSAKARSSHSGCTAARPTKSRRNPLSTPCWPRQRRRWMSQQ